MSGTLPTVRGGAQALYPVTRTVQFATDVAIALNATEQRFKRRPPLTTFSLPYARMNSTDTAAMKAFFESQKGEFDSTWSFTLGATTYSALTFLDEAFTVREEAGAPKCYSFTLQSNSKSTLKSGHWPQKTQNEINAAASISFCAFCRFVWLMLAAPRSV